MQSIYGQIAGYAFTNADGSVGDQTEPIAVSVGQVIQFANYDGFQPVEILHTATGFPNAKGFPSIPYAFPKSAFTQVGDAITAGNWSTGAIPPGNGSTVCYSQPFTVPAAGTFYFGDAEYYNTTTSLRDVIVVTQP